MAAKMAKALNIFPVSCLVTHLLRRDLNSYTLNRPSAEYHRLRNIPTIYQQKQKKQDLKRENVEIGNQNCCLLIENYSKFFYLLFLLLDRL